MKPSKLLLFSLTLLLALPAAPQDAAPKTAASAPTAVPPLIPYSGVVGSVSGLQSAADASITFLIYKDEQGGEPALRRDPDRSARYRRTLQSATWRDPLQRYPAGAVRDWRSSLA